jgi:hypothetical protein
MRRLSSRGSTAKDLLDDAERGSTPLPMHQLPALASARGSSPEPEDDEDEEYASPGMSPPLPPPALQASNSGTRRTRKSARIDGGGLRVHWARFKKRVGTGTAPSTSEVTGSVVTGGSSVMLPRASGAFERKGRDDEKGGVDEVVVDRPWFDEIKSSVVSQSEAEGGPRDSHGGAYGMAGTINDHDSVALHAEGFWALNMALVVLRYRCWPAIYDFFTLRFVDQESEDRYRKETWFLQKSLAVWSAIFLITNWVRLIQSQLSRLSVSPLLFVGSHYWNTSKTGYYCRSHLLLWRFVLYSDPLLNFVKATQSPLRSPGPSSRWSCGTGPVTVLSFTRFGSQFPFGAGRSILISECARYNAC